MLEVLTPQTGNIQPQPLFTKPGEYQKVQQWFAGEMSREMEKSREARRKSEDESRRRLVR